MITSKLKIKLCMGSSCFSRGNNETLVVLEQFIEENELTDKVELEGKLCMNACSKGPSLTINDKKYEGVQADCIADLLRHHLKEIE